MSRPRRGLDRAGVEAAFGELELVPARDLGRRACLLRLRRVAPSDRRYHREIAIGSIGLAIAVLLHGFNDYFITEGLQSLWVLFIALIFTVANVVRQEYAIARYLSFSGHGRRSLFVWNITFIGALASAFVTKTTADFSRVSFVAFYVFGFAAICLALSTLARWSLSLIRPDVFFTPYIPAVFFATAVGGAQIGVLTALIGGVLGLSLSFGAGPADFARIALLLIFWGVAGLTIWGIEHYRAIAAQQWAMFAPHYTLPPYPRRAAMEAVVREELAPTNPRALDVTPEDFYDDRFVRALDESGFVRALGGP